LFECIEALFGVACGNQSPELCEAESVSEFELVQRSKKEGLARFNESLSRRRGV
jgi:hypothetical protein